MSLVKVINVPEVEQEVSKLVNKWLLLCQGYRHVQMRCFNDELNLPMFARLFELIRYLESRYVDEIIRFQISRGQKITWFDVKPIEVLEKANLPDMIETILYFEKDIHQFTIQLDKLSWEKGDLPLTAFLKERVIPRQVKVIRKRANQLRDLMRTDDNVIPLLTERLNIRFEIEKLEERLRLEVLRREYTTGHCYKEKLIGEKETLLIGSMSRF